ncbi:hypothetical protein GGR22_002907 [Flavobacterium gossypii]|uniref:Uncharacterized protein n=1 Tax=Flavobacterium gossypii TaxID=1646119 RepID=A0ABR6DTG8_9FLAO|nr:hypothetical protein [Flavobacterium gossypii]MBA9074734.1 hypothetical protein [Flavobacterium gossypii]
MEYNKLVDGISERAGINRKLFDLDFDQKDGDGIMLRNRQDSNHHYFRKCEHWENTRERWKSTVLFVPSAIIKDFLGILNSIFEENDEETIDLDNIPATFEYHNDDKSFNVLLGTEGEYYRIELAKKDE